MAVLLGVVLLALISASGQQDAIQKWHLVLDRVYEDDVHAPMTAVSQVSTDSGGNVYIRDGQAEGVYVFDVAGGYRSTFGRRGSGPGEFQAISRLGWLDDTLWVSDLGARRVTLFRNDGSVALVRVDPQLLSRKTGLPFRLRALMRGGCTLMAEGTTISTASALESLGESLIRTCAGSALLDTLWTINLRDRFLVVTIPSTPPGQFQGFQPWSHADVWSISTGGDRLAFVAQPEPGEARNGEYQLTIIDDSGAIEWSHKVPYRPVRLTEDHVNEWLGPMLTQLVNAFPSPVAARKALGERLYRPAHMPPVLAVVLGQDSTVWVQRREASGVTRWDVFDRWGKLMAQAEVVGAVTLHEVRGAFAWGVDINDLDVPRVARYRIVR